MSRLGNLEYLYKELYKPIFRYFYGRTGDKDLAEDLTQEVFFKVHKQTVKGEQMDNLPKAYFFTIARNTLIDEWRKSKPEHLSPEVWEVLPGGEDGEKPVLAREARDIVGLALSSLESEVSDIISWRYLAGLSNKEISELTGKSEESIRQIQSRGLRKLREEFKKYGE